MLRLTFLLCFIACGLCCGQQTSPLEILLQDEEPLRIKAREYPEAKKAFAQYRLKVISGSVVGASGVILLNHSLGSISPRKPHQWAVTGIGAGLVTAGLFITKGAKKKRQEAKDIVKEKKSVAFQWQPNGLKIPF
ncbi:MAG: hypothetical protein P8O78_08245 [Flavobacteriaceae bacterium]|nr:hypothetical protein [Flavobacteriaceae bacterium]